MSTDMLGVEAGDPLLLSFYGTAAAYNKSLRKELINVRTKRDRFLQARMKILKPFLIDKVTQSVLTVLQVFLFHSLCEICVCCVHIFRIISSARTVWRLSAARKKKQNGWS